ncbi:MAG TPA: amidohydrolase family protein [Parvibaculum sp.]
MHDLVIRGGTVYDGTGSKPVEADIAIEGRTIVAVGKVAAGGREEIDAKGQIVTPGFVDVHTHYDGQVTWDPYLQPSTFHGVTTAVMGNCGVGFAPCKPEQRQWLLGLMEGVEDIPGTALAEGIKWNWESFAQYMDAVEASPLALDVGLQIPHAAVRAYVMGERAPALEPATEADTEEMGRIVVEALNAGALGFSTSRTLKHKDVKGASTPTLKAEAMELHGIARAMGKAGKGVLQLIADFKDTDAEFAMLRGMVEISKRPMSITIEQDDRWPDVWARVLHNIAEANKAGLPIKGQVPPRATGLLLGLTASLNPFVMHQTFRQIWGAPLEEQLKALRDPEFRAKLLAEEPAYPAGEIIEMICTAYHKMFALGEIPNYEPAPEESVKARAERAGKNPREVVLDLMLERDGKALLYFPLMNYHCGSLADVETMLTHPNTAFGLSDGGAHCGIICDASFPSTLLTHWGRDRTRGRKLPLEWLIHGLTGRNAELIGMLDRGILAPGMKADVNVIDFDRLKLYSPRIVNDLPAGGKRLIQQTDGYTASIVSGTVAFRNGDPTGALNGRLVRGAQARPAGARIAAAAD